MMLYYVKCLLRCKRTPVTLVTELSCQVAVLATDEYAACNKVMKYIAKEYAIKKTNGILFSLKEIKISTRAFSGVYVTIG